MNISLLEYVASQIYAGQLDSLANQGGPNRAFGEPDKSNPNALASHCTRLAISSVAAADLLVQCIRVRQGVQPTMSVPVTAFPPRPTQATPSAFQMPTAATQPSAPAQEVASGFSMEKFMEQLQAGISTLPEKEQGAVLSALNAAQAAGLDAERMALFFGNVVKPSGQNGQV